MSSEPPLDEPQTDADELMMLAGILMADGPFDRDNAAKMLVRVAEKVDACDRRLHKRKCHSCGNVDWHTDNITPYVCCGKCSSQAAKTRGGLLDEQA